MENISAFLNKPRKPIKAPNSERAELVGYFMQQINRERAGTKWKPVTPRYIAVKLAHIKSLTDLYYFKSICEDYAERKGSFSRCFFGALTVNQTDV